MTAPERCDAPAPCRASRPTRSTAPLRLRSPRGYALIDALLGGLLLAIALVAVLSLSARSLQMERAGEEEVVAASLLDEVLSLVLAEGPVDFPKVHDTAGRFDPPFGDWEFEVLIEAQGLGDPWRVLAIVRSPSGATYRCGTLLAPRPEDAPIIMRRPPQRLEREDRYEAARQSVR
ncbi:MAG: hypothetical protein KF724_03400 [Phycisphaeraceae bacterium]|nr:hypothetical protein [Phycisphaeraceae bacterium]